MRRAGIGLNDVGVEGDVLCIAEIEDDRLGPVDEIS